jgi:hypothetical protein
MIKLRERERPWWLLAPARVSFAWWVAMAAALLVVEYATGLYNQFPVAYVIPVSLAAYYSGRVPALLLAVAIPIVHLAFVVLDQEPTDVFGLAAFAVFRGSVIVFMALWFARLSDHERALVDEVHTLKGLLPICSFCKSIRNDSGEWELLERFISRRSQTQFSHGICPACQQTHYYNRFGGPGGGRVAGSASTRAASSNDA